MQLFYSFQQQKNFNNGKIKNLFTTFPINFAHLTKLLEPAMRNHSVRYDTRESLMAALVELMALQIPVEEVAPVLCTIGPVDLDLLADCMNDVGLNDNLTIAA
jgi:hypothetical protein